MDTIKRLILLIVLTIVGGSAYSQATLSHIIEGQNSISTIPPFFSNSNKTIFFSMSIDREGLQSFYIFDDDFKVADTFSVNLPVQLKSAFTLVQKTPVQTLLYLWHPTQEQGVEACAYLSQGIFSKSGYDYLVPMLDFSYDTTQERPIIGFDIKNTSGTTSCSVRFPSGYSCSSTVLCSVYCYLMNNKIIATVQCKNEEGCNVMLVYNLGNFSTGVRNIKSSDAPISIIPTTPKPSEPIRIDIPQEYNGVKTISVTALNGSTILNAQTDDEVYFLDSSLLSKGMNIVTVVTEQGARETQKVIVQ